MINGALENTEITQEGGLTIPIRIGWSAPFAIFLNILLLCCLFFLLSGNMQANPPGVEWLGVAIIGIMLVILDVLFVPQLARHYIRFEKNHLQLVLGLHKARLNYSDILAVSEKFSGIAFQWNSTAPGAVRIHGRTFDEVVAVADKNELYAELLERNPSIKINRA